MTAMGRTDRRATPDEVRSHADALKRAAHEIGRSDIRILEDGTLVVHSDDEGLREDGLALRNPQGT